MNMKHNWTLKEENRLRELYPEMPSEKIAKKFGRTISSIWAKAHKLGLKKERRFKTNLFPSGHTPWNKGIYYCAGGDSAKYRFKPGHIPHNARRDGEMYIGKDHGRSYWFIKPPGSRHIQIYHRWRWKQLYGSIPQGYIVTFRDGDAMNVRDSNLICISRLDNLKRNTGRVDRQIASFRAWATRGEKSFVDRVLMCEI